MPYDPERHHRRSIRLPAYDYTRPGMYALTICTHARLPLFGRLDRGHVVLSAAGQVASDEWQRTSEVRPSIALDAFVVMPNHIHAIVIIVERATEASAPQHSAHGRPRVAPRSLGAIIQGYKAAVTGQLRAAGWCPGPVWQRNYYESILRTEEDLAQMRRYIADNPRRVCPL
jgi:putative transposase